MKRSSILVSLLSFIVISFVAIAYKRSYHTAPITIGLVGDVMIGRTINELLTSNPGHNLWGTMLSFLQNQDLLIANLETAITTHEQAVPKVFNFKTDPVHVKVLKQAGIDIVNLANNHILDYGVPGLEETLDTLQKAGIAWVGAGMDAQQARSPYFFTVDNTRIAILGATDNEPSWKAGVHTPGTNYITIGDTQFLDDIARARAQADIVIATLHWGPNMREYPSENFIDYAHKMIDAGADIIAGHSAHIIQGIEQYKNKLIMYDMGDFIDDYAIDSILRNDLAALFVITIQNKTITKLTIIPARIETMVVNRASKEDQNIIFDHIKRRSLPFNTLFHQEDSVLSVLFNEKYSIHS